MCARKSGTTRTWRDYMHSSRTRRQHRPSGHAGRYRLDLTIFCSMTNTPFDFGSHSPRRTCCVNVTICSTCAPRVGWTCELSWRDCTRGALDFRFMGEQLKSFFSPALVRRLAGDIARVHPAFPARRFVAQACAGLDALELLDRGRHIARALARHLPESYPDAIAVLLRSLGPEHACDELIGAGMAPFFYLPHTIFVSEHGLDHFESRCMRSTS